jgi:hypothetical protein
MKNIFNFLVVTILSHNGQRGSLLVFNISYILVTRVSVLLKKVTYRAFRNQVLSSMFGQPEAVSRHHPHRAHVLQDV